MRNQRVAGEVHLRHEPARERRPEQGEVDVRRPPRVGVVAPRVRAWLDRDEPVDALLIGEAAAGAGEVGIQGGRVVVDGVDVSPRRVRLPDLDQRVPHRPAVGVGDPTGDDDPLAQRLAGMLTGQVCVLRLHRDAPEDWSAGLVKPLRWQFHQRVARRTQLRRAIVRIEIRRFELELARHP